MVNLSFTISVERLKHILLTCSLRKDKSNSIFENIVGAFYPEGKLVVMSRSTHVFSANEFTGIQVSGISEPTTCVIRAKEIFELLPLYKGDIKLTLDIKNEEWIIESSSETRKKKNQIPTKEESEISTATNDYPFTFNESGVPLLKKGTFAMNIIAEIPVQALKDQISEVELLGMDPRFYTIEFDDQNEVIRTYAGDRSQRAKKRGESEEKVVSISGSGESTYALGYENVINNLDGIINFYCVNNGPCWIVQEGENFKLQYMLSPSLKV